jgi:hypothetical protein
VTELRAVRAGSLPTCDRCGELLVFGPHDFHGLCAPCERAVAEPATAPPAGSGAP